MEQAEPSAPMAVRVCKLRSVTASSHSCLAEQTMGFAGLSTAVGYGLHTRNTHTPLSIKGQRDASHYLHCLKIKCLLNYHSHTHLFLSHSHTGTASERCQKCFCLPVDDKDRNDNDPFAALCALSLFSGRANEVDSSVNALVVSVDW